MLLAHQTEAMARQKILRSPDHYLNGRRHRPKLGSRAVVAAMLQAEKRGLNVSVRRLPPPKPKE